MFVTLSKLRKIKWQSVYPSDLLAIDVGSAHATGGIRTMNLIIWMCITVCFVQFGCFLFYVHLLFYTQKLHTNSCVVKNVRMRFDQFFPHSVYRLLPYCCANVTGIKVALLFSVRIMGSELSHVSFRLCHYEMDNLQDNVHVMTEPLSHTLRLPLTSFWVSISLVY